MKKITFTLLFTALFGLAINAQVVEPVQRSIIIKRTASWCPNCGTWGWSMFESLIEEVEGPAGILLAAHYSGSLMNQAAADITNNFGGFSQPRFYLNGVDQNVTSSNWQSKKDDIKGAVETLYANTAPVAALGVNAYYFADTGELTFETKTNIYQDVTGKFYLALYLVENDVVGPQSGQGNDAVHQRLIQESLFGSSFGEVLAEGTFVAGATFENTFTTTRPDFMDHNYEVVAILWQEMSDGTFGIINGLRITEFDPTVSGVEQIPAREATLRVLPTPAAGQASVELVLAQSGHQVQLELVDLSGRVIRRFSEGFLPEGTHRFDISKAEAGGAGQYFIRLEMENKVRVMPLIFQ
ncbi:MAG: hypothetical protein D6714_05525 [Bacteroidetes bacterium]|nr:MAG: hypothetical protein D6714_05525 [Bacteroidota bacterium]